MDAFYIGLAVGLGAALFFCEGKNCKCKGVKYTGAAARAVTGAGAGSGSGSGCGTCAGTIPSDTPNSSSAPHMYPASTFRVSAAPRQATPMAVNIFGGRVAYDPSNFVQNVTQPTGGYN